MRALDREFERFFREARRSLGSTGSAALAPGGREWLLDNDFVVAEALEALEGALPARFLSRLPGLRHPEPMRGRPRIEVLALELVDRHAGGIELDEVALFLEGYQEIIPLRLAELWALPSFLRLILLERLLAEVTGAGEEVEVGPFMLSLRTLAGQDWRGVVESLSRVEKTLRLDPAGVYSEMDFRTRDRYRKEVERIAQHVDLEEEVVGRQVLEMARTRAGDPHEGHVGYYLVDDGREAVFRELGHKPPWAGVPATRRMWAGWLYFGGVGLLSLVLLAALWTVTGAGGLRLLFLALGAFPAVGVSVAFANRLAGHLVGPRTLPRLDVREGIPDRFRTVVAVPVLLGSREDVRHLVHTLEVNYQANPDPALTFALLSDFADAPTERTERDAQLLTEAVQGIRGLNARYGLDGSGPFLLLHRTRRWNPAETRWMGWERKRGKLAELNQLLLGHPSGLWVAEGDAGRLDRVPFVLTLDADTRLPRDAAARLVGTLAHPLNRPEIGAGGRIQRGYSVLQPRIEILPDPDGGTRFSRVFGGIQGLDLYAHAAFDVYQDLFDVGIFAGKGIYDVEAFEASLAGRTPENTLLSHDLFEGAHGRAGLVSDLVLLEDFPAHPLTYARRAHRWIRGDWQILPWLLPRVPGEHGERRRNRLSRLSRWMILDNLRRSLQPAALLGLLLLGWAFLPQYALGWTVGLLAVLGVPFLIGSVDALARAIRELPRRADLEAERKALLRALGRWGLDLTLLPFEAWMAGDAIVRTLHRLYRSHRNLLEWTSAAVTARSVSESDSLVFSVRQMKAGPLVATGAAGFLLARGALPMPAVPLLLLWTLSPLIAHRISRPPKPMREPRGHFPRDRAREMARRIWGYYERFQGPERHWLAPDHFQEDPGGEIAHRTSPTNVGMAMVSAVTAWDLGFSGSSRFITQIRNTVEGMRGLTRYRGHFLNWYDTSSLEPLHPLYVSTVDSGNLAAAFIVSREALGETRDRPFWTHDRGEGILDTVRVVSELLRGMHGDGAAQALLAETVALEGWIDRHLPEAWRRGMPAYVAVLEALRDQEVAQVETHFLRMHEAAEHAAAAAAWSAVHAWLGRVRGDVEQTLDELFLFLPWLAPPYREGAEAQAIHRRVFDEGAQAPSLRRLEVLLRREVGRAEGGGGGNGEGPSPVHEPLRQAALTAQLLLEDVSRVMELLDRWYQEMDFSFLYDTRRDLFRIGFSVSAGVLDPNHYDLLASEARIASLVAMSKGEAPPAHWLHLARPFTWTRRGPVLLSWAGTMFEYLMPALFLRMPPDTVLEESCRRAVDVQRDYGTAQRVPWGISESGYHVLSPEGHYQYRAFGVPVLGLRANPGTRLVVAPYASLMAVGIAPGAAFKNLELLQRMGGVGPWGPYEALDFGRDAEWKYEPRVVRSYMSHHHGMILGALGNHLTGNRIVERFHRDPRIGTVEPYLYERIPWRRATGRKWVDRSVPLRGQGTGPGIQSWSPPAETLPPPMHHLASGKLVVAMGPDGRGGSRWRGWSIVRGGVGQGMPVGGPDLVLLDRSTGRSWRPLPDPAAPERDDQQIVFEPHRAEFMRKSMGIRTRMDVLIPPDSDVEVRDFVIANESARPRHLRLAVSAELALAPYLDDLRHPAFHKLFVRAEALPGGEGLVFERRSRGADEVPPVLLVTILGTNGEPPPLRWGTSREVFLGRRGTRWRPAALDDPHRLTNPSMPHHPLDPMASAVINMELAPWGDLSLTFLLAVGPDRETVIRNASELRSTPRRDWARIQARARAEGELLRLGARAVDPMIWSELLAHVVSPRGRPWTGDGSDASIDLKQSSLWRWGISGDLPFILVEGETHGGSGVLGELVRAQRWWRDRGQPVDVVVVGHGVGEYQDLVREQVRKLLASVGGDDLLGRPGGVHIVRAEDTGEEERLRLRALAAVVLDGGRSSLQEQLASVRPPPAPLPTLTDLPRQGIAREGADGAPGPGGSEKGPSLAATSAFGGFDVHSGEYVIALAEGEVTPAPWVNIIARDKIGFLVTESGGSFTWAEDAGEFRITPWSNDPVLGLSGEALYLRDEDDARVWTPAPGPLGLRRAHEVRHGWGRTMLTASDQDVDEEVSWFLHPTLPAKVVRIRLRNRGNRPRRLSATFFAEWVLGSHASNVPGRLQVRFDFGRSSIVARNPYLLKFADRVAFLASDRSVEGMATDRQEFLGTAGPFDQVPVGLRRIEPGERATPDGQGCAVLKRGITLAPGEEEVVSFFLGAAQGAQLDEVLRELRSAEAPPDLSESDRERWQAYLGRVRVRTPDPEMDRLLNGWLPYQTVVSRLHGRTGFYQSGGAFGFRDQLQDVYTLLPLDPTLAADHLIEAARRQFQEGDVLHWWHPDTTRGVRTRCSDDLLWLPWVLAQTVRWTGDRTLLDRRAPFLVAPPLEEGVDERYDAFPVSEKEATLLEHALRAVERTAGLLSSRGLPLIGTGDWNDGMDRVGREGKGESIWLGWFFLDVCRLIVPLVRARGEEFRARRMEAWSVTVRQAIEAHGWDGEWYRRAFFDDGTPLGSRNSREARIDSLAQSWGVISGAADPERARMGLESAWRELVDPDTGIVLLLTPPFEGAGPDPGYIAAYPPGVRENGGQYTHAASWLIRAFARSGDGDRAGELLRLLLPTRHAAGREGTHRYRVEPYVIAADVYGAEPHVGRGGWTWYTGSAGWIWRVAIEDILGFRREGDFLRIDPCIPSEWDGFEMEVEVDGVRVRIRVRNPDHVCRGVGSCRRNGRKVDPLRVPLVEPEEDRDGSGAAAGEPVTIELVLGEEGPVTRVADPVAEREDETA